MGRRPRGSLWRCLRGRREDLAPKSKGFQGNIEKLAEEFVERHRLGKKPTLTEYIDRYPELADDIRELFPALMEMEQLGSVTGSGPLIKTGATDNLPRQLGDYAVLVPIVLAGVLRAAYQPDKQKAEKQVKTVLLTELYKAYCAYEVKQGKPAEKIEDL